MFQIQTLIHKIEVGGGRSYLKYALLPVVILALFVVYDFRGSRNFSDPAAMDAAQLARNVADHRGWTTSVVRPFSVYLFSRAYTDKHGPATLGDTTDRGHLRGPHPDISNPPVYPLVLAALMKTSSAFKYHLANAAPVKIGKWKVNLWSNNGHFWIYPPDFWIGVFNQILFLALAVAIFYFTRRLFDSLVAWTSALIFLGTDLFWRFSVSGLSTMFVMLIFFALCWLLARLEEKTRVAQLSQNRQTVLAALIGLTAGIGCLTRYSFGFLIIPVTAFLILFLGRNRILLAVIALGAFALVVGPWTARNYQVSHTLFGTAGYAVYENTPEFPEYRLERSLHPDLTKVHFWRKVSANLQTSIEQDIPRLGGSWIGAFFLVGLLISFQNPTLSRLRYFVLFCLLVLLIVQAFIRTKVSEDLPAVNSENLLILIAPLVIIFGVSLFYTLVDQIQFPIPQLRYPVIGGFFALICLPALITFAFVLNPFATRGNAIAYPPYYPPLIQQIAVWMKPQELIMSDVPWAVAWYADRECLLLTLDSDKSFYEINDYQRPIAAIYLTPVTMDEHFLTDWVNGGEHNWGTFLNTRQLPANFPLSHAPGGFLPDQFFLTDSDRWLIPDATNAPAK
jgi:hypothetical protein